MREASDLAEDDPELLRDIAIAKQELERAEAKYLAGSLVVEGTPERLEAAWKLRVANAQSGGNADIEALLVTKMQHSLGLLLQDLDTEIAAGKPGRAAEILPRLPSYPGVSAEVEAPTRIASLAGRAATPHAERAHALAAFPLAQRGHLGLAASYVGGTLPDATALTAPTRVAINVRGTSAAACRSSADELTSRFSRPGEGRQLELELDLASCTEAESSSTSVEEVSWDVQVPYKTFVTQTVQECELKSVPQWRYSCRVEIAFGAKADYKVCSNETYQAQITVCSPKTVRLETIAFRTEKVSGKRTVTKTRTAIELTGSFVVRRSGQRDRAGSIRERTERTDVTYPAVVALAARLRSPDTTTPVMIDQARNQIADQIRTEIAAVLEADLVVARTVVAQAAAAGDRDGEEDALVRLILLGERSAGALATRYGVTAEQVRHAFDETSFTGWRVPPSMSLPGVETIPELDAAQRTEVARRRRTGLPPPLVMKGWFTFGVGGFVTDTATSPTNAQLLGYSGINMTGRFGASVLGRWRGGAYGPVLADDASLRIDAGFPLSRATDQFDGGTVLRAAAVYTLGVGFRAHRRGGILVGARALASYEVMEGISAVSVPLFGRVEIPLPAGSVCLEAYGRPVAGDAVAGGALYLTAETLRRGDTSSQFIAIRAERTAADRTATFTDDAFNEITQTFTKVPSTQVTVELGAAF